MIEYKDECCGCAAPGYPCLGNSCSNRHVPHYYCDICGKEILEEPSDYCAECAKELEGEDNV